MARNKPLQAQQPAPPFANDSGGYWNGVLEANRTSGLASVLPAETVLQSDTAIKGRLLEAQIGWVPISCRWKGSIIQASLSDAQFFLALESGGDTQQGRITIVVNKFLLGVRFPSYNETFEIQAAGKWHQFVIAEMIGQNDDNEPALTLYLEKDQDNNGE